MLGPQGLLQGSQNGAAHGYHDDVAVSGADLPFCSTGTSAWEAAAEPQALAAVHQALTTRPQRTVLLPLLGSQRYHVDCLQGERWQVLSWLLGKAVQPVELLPWVSCEAFGSWCS